MTIKIALVFLMIMLGLAFFGRFRMSMLTGPYCQHCGKRKPCGCGKGRT